jgi:hypothetical protein
MNLHVPRGLPTRQSQFLCLLAARPSLTRADYQRLVAVSHNVAQKDLAELLRSGLVRRLGRGRDCRYALGLAAVTESPAETGPQEGRGPDHNLTTVAITIDPLIVSSPRR